MLELDLNKEWISSKKSLNFWNAYFNAGLTARELAGAGVVIRLVGSPEQCQCDIRVKGPGKVVRVVDGMWFFLCVNMVFAKMPEPHLYLHAMPRSVKSMSKSAILRIAFAAKKYLRDEGHKQAYLDAFTAYVDALEAQVNALQA